MNRRDFVKLLGLTPPALVASKTLAGLPEIEPQIQLLETKKTIKTSPDVFIFNHVIQFEFENSLKQTLVVEQSYRPTLPKEPLFTIPNKVIKAEVYLDDNEHNQLLDNMLNNISVRCKFSLPTMPLIFDGTFTIVDLKLVSRINSFPTAYIKAVLIEGY